MADYEDIDFDEMIIDESLDNLIQEEVIVVTENDISMADECDFSIESSSLDIGLTFHDENKIEKFVVVEPEKSTKKKTSSSKTYTCSICKKIYKREYYKKEHEKKCSKYKYQTLLYILLNKIPRLDFQKGYENTPNSLLLTFLVLTKTWRIRNGIMRYFDIL